MLISRHVFDGAKSAERGRQRAARTGFVGGHRVWKPEEDRILLRHYPNYAAVRKALPDRTYYAIRGRALTLGIQNKRPQWTGADLVRMRKLYPSASPEQLLAAFPGRSFGAIHDFAKRMHILKKRPDFRQTGHPLLDAIRARCKELGYSMGDLDQIARTKRYFKGAGWHRYKSAQTAALCKAVEALDGTLSVIWSDAGG